MRAKELRLKIRDLKNRITGKDKVIGEYKNITQKIKIRREKI